MFRLNATVWSAAVTLLLSDPLGSNIMHRRRRPVLEKHDKTLAAKIFCLGLLHLATCFLVPVHCCRGAGSITNFTRVIFRLFYESVVTTAFCLFLLSMITQLSM